MIQKIVIVEDEKLNVDRLKRLVKEIDSTIEILSVLDSVTDAVDWLREYQHPDLILMDIRLSDGLCFEIFEKVSIKCPIIFTTAYDEYAVQAFKYNSVDYILKPVEKDNLAKALDKVRNTIDALQHHNSIERLLEYIKPKEYRSRLLIPFRDGFNTVNIEDIACIYSDMKITYARLKNHKDVILNLPLDELEKQLNPKYFFRANRQFIININSVQRVVHSFNRKLKVLLCDSDFEIIVSRDKATVLKDWLDS